MAKILIVDDDPTNRSLLVTLLGYRGHRTLEATDGAEALALAKSWFPDLVVSDVLMPTMDGYEFVRLLREDPAIAAVPVMFYTAHYHQKQARALGQACGVTQILVKPAEPEDILRVVETLLQDGASAGVTAAPDQQFQTAHLRVVTDELALMSGELGSANARLAALMDLNLRLASERDPPTLLHKVCQGARKLIGAGYVVLAVRVKGGSPDVLHFHSGVAAGCVGIEQPPSLTRGRLSHVMLDQETWRATALRGTAAASAGLPAGYPSLESVLAVPIQSLTESFGWLMLANKIGDEGFSADDQRITEILAAQVGRIYENGSLYHQVQRHSLQLQQEITERKRSEERALKLNRLYAMLSQINTLIIRAPTSQALCDNACRIAIEHGEFAVAWIGMLSASGEIDPIASSHDGSDLGAHGPAFTVGLSLREGSVAQVAASTGQPVVCGNLRDTTHVIRNRELLLANGCKGLVVLPLMVEEQCVGYLNLLSGQERAFDEDRLALLKGLARDIAFGIDHLRKAERIQHLAFYDTLTGLANRTLFLDRLGQSLVQGDRQSTRTAVLVVDIARFHTLNETFGRKAGDDLLRELSRRLVACVGDPARVARIASNQFAILVREFGAGDDPALLLERYWPQWDSEPLTLEGQDLHVTLRAGIALFPTDAQDSVGLLKAAEIALREAKVSGQHQAFYTSELSHRLYERQRMEGQLRHALENNEFVLHYQPKVLVDGRTLSGFEALIRWQNPELGLVPPVRFIPLLEEMGLIADVGAWVLFEAHRQRKAWLAAGFKVPRVAINVSTLQLGRADFAQRFAEVLGATDDGGGIDIEVTESLIINDAERHIERLNEIRQLGVDIAVDDFGTGYSSLGYLAKLPVQTLKIDRSFITTMLQDSGSMTLVSTIISLAHALRLSVVAEGVEDEAQAKILRLLRCDEMQGYLISRPLPAPEIPALLAR